MSDCTICRIASDELFARIVLHDAETLAFFPREPQLRGHTIVAPRAHVGTWDALPGDLVGPFFEVVQRVSRRLCSTLDAQAVNVLFAGGAAAQQSVPHFHVHVLPRRADDGVDAWPSLPGCSDDLDELLACVRIDDAAVQLGAAADDAPPSRSDVRSPHERRDRRG